MQLRIYFSRHVYSHDFSSPNYVFSFRFNPKLLLILYLTQYLEHRLQFLEKISNCIASLPKCIGFSSWDIDAVLQRLLYEFSDNSFFRIFPSLWSFGERSAIKRRDALGGRIEKAAAKCPPRVGAAGVHQTFDAADRRGLGLRPRREAHC